MKFHENPSSGSRDLPCGRTDRQTQVMKLIAAFRNFASLPKNVCLSITGQSIYVIIIMIQNKT